MSLQSAKIMTLLDNNEGLNEYIRAKYNNTKQLRLTD